MLHGVGGRGLVVRGTIEARRGELYLALSDGTQRRLGPDIALHGEVRRLLSAEGVDLREAEPASTATLRNFQRPSGAILEVTSYCDVGCGLCIAGSLPTRELERSPAYIKSALDWVFKSGDWRTKPLFLSGGEPTQHKSFMEIVAAKSFLQFPSRYVITSGIDFSRLEFCQQFKERSPDTRVYLQYDSTRAKDIVGIRGKDLTRFRSDSIANLEICGIPYYLICVVVKNLNDEVIQDIIEQNIRSPHCLGIVFQPVRFVGRNETIHEGNALTPLDVACLVEKWCNKGEMFKLTPHPLNPANWYIAVEGGLHTENGLLCTGNRKSILVVGHTDAENAILESTVRNPICFVEAERLTPLEVHYNTFGIESKTKPISG